MGPWVHPEIDNPDYVHIEDVYKMKPIGFIGLEVWQVKAGTIFDNILLTDDKDLAKERRDAVMKGFKKEKIAHELVKKEEEEKAKAEAEAAEEAQDDDDDDLDEDADLDELDNDKDEL